MVMLLAILASSATLISWSTHSANTIRYQNQKISTRELAKAGIDKALFCLNGNAETADDCGGTHGDSYTGESNIFMADGSFTTAITIIDSRTKQITSTGYYPSATSTKARTTLRTQVEINTDEIHFNFGMQVGDNGLIMKNNSAVTGNVFSNGPITGTSASKCSITGSATTAGTSTISKIKVWEDMHANNISSCIVLDDAYYNTISGSIVYHHSYHPYPNADPADFPVSDAQIARWIADASAEEPHDGDYILDGGETASLGPKKIIGNLLLDNNSTLMLTGVIYVTGNITLDNGASIHLDSAYGSRSGVIVADGFITMGNATIDGAGTDSTIMLMTTATGGGGNGSAIEIRNNAIGAVFFAPNGLIWVNNRVWVTELVGKSVDLEENAVLWYDYGLLSTEFSSGPGGGWAILRGTWQEL
jgi:hypothetical protein